MLTSRTVLSLTVAILAVISTAALPAADEVKTTTIQGTVIMNGKPLVGRILFHLDKRQFVGAKLDEEGKFTIDRVPLGDRLVTVEGKGVPESYASEKLSALKVQVVEGQNEFNFELVLD
jgi:hypothetical protein